MKTRKALAEIQRRIENARRKHDKELILQFRYYDGDESDDYVATISLLGDEEPTLRSGHSQVGFAEALNELAHTSEIQDKEFG